MYQCLAERANRPNRNLAVVVLGAVFWEICKVRNRACFQKEWPDEPISVIFRICYWINWWSSLQVKDSAMNRLWWLAKLVEQMTTDVFNARRSWVSWTPRLMARLFTGRSVAGEGAIGFRKTDMRDVEEKT
jgi:hypothetical protein